MVEPVGAKPVTQGRVVTLVERSAPVERSRSAVNTQPDLPATGGLASLIADYAATPPVDLDRVAKIRHAIESNAYPIIAETVADRLIAIKLNWKPQ